MKTRSTGLLLALVLLPLLFSPAVRAGEEGARTIRDMAGRSVEVPASPRRLMCLGPGCLRLIVYLGAQDRVAGIEEMELRFPGGRPYFLAHPELKDLPAVTPGGVAAINNKPDMEGVLSVHPDLVLATYLEAVRADEVQALLGVPLVVLDYGPFASFDEEVYRSLELLGDILGRRERAREVVDFLEAGRRDLARRMEGIDPRPRAYVGGIGFKGTQGLTSSDASFIPFAWLGVENLAARGGKTGHVDVSREELLALDPPVIFLDGGGLALTAEDFAKRPEFYNALRAFREGAVHVLHPFNWYVTNLGTVLADAYAAGKILAPERFRDVDSWAKADEIYTFLTGRPVQAEMAGTYGPLGARPGFMKGAGR